MGNLKLKKKKAKSADLASLASKIKAVNDAIAMKLISFVDGEPTALIWPQILVGKNKAYLEIFAGNLWTYWKIHSGKMPEETKVMTLTIKDVEHDVILFTFSDFDGLTEF